MIIQTPNPPPYTVAYFSLSCPHLHHHTTHSPRPFANIHHPPRATHHRTTPSPSSSVPLLHALEAPTAPWATQRTNRRPPPGSQPICLSALASAVESTGAWTMLTRQERVVWCGSARVLSGETRRGSLGWCDADGMLLERVVAGV